jgi:hypothetical protein
LAKQFQIDVREVTAVVRLFRGGAFLPPPAKILASEDASYSNVTLQIAGPVELV